MDPFGLQWYWIVIISTGIFLVMIVIIWVTCKKCRACA
jgi:hypothetical protein